MKAPHSRALCALLLAVSPCWVAPCRAARPSTPMGDISAGMMDSAAFGKLMLDELELEGGQAATRAAWHAEGWYGRDYDKLWLKSEGEWLTAEGAQAESEALWDHALSAWWNGQAGIRYDLGGGPARGWLAVGVQGVAPYQFESEVTLYASDTGHAALRLRTEQDLLFTQRLILQPQLEAELYSRSDPARLIGAGLSDLQLALRLRYEVRREVAPYVGVSWRRAFGRTAAFQEAHGAPASALQWVAGARLWF